MIEAELPNITGNCGGFTWNSWGTNGAFTEKMYSYFENDPQNEKWRNTQIRFDASRSNPIYGNASTVQPPAYVVHFYRRIA